MRLRIEVDDGVGDGVSGRWAEATSGDSMHMIGVLDRLETVGDRHNRDLTVQFAQRLSDQRLRATIERAGGLIEEKEIWFASEGSRDGDSLSLATGELVSELSDRR